MRSITVDLGERSYPIYIGSGLLQSIGERCTEAGSRSAARCWW